jgi:hypothetical protein
MTRARLPLIFLLLLGSPGLATAGKGYSSGSHSFSSGSHSSSSHSSSSHSSSSSSHSSSSGGKSYSSGGGKSYSSGSSSRPSSSGSSSSSRPASSSSPRPSTSGSPSRPAGSSYDSPAANAARHSESRGDYERRTPAGGKRYSEGNAPPGRPTYTPGPTRSTYNDASGRAHPIDPKDRRIDQLRRELNEERWYNRSQRMSSFYWGIGPPLGYPVVTYSDPYSNFFWWWLLSQSLDYRSSWAYNHYYDMDQLRYRDMMDRDAALEARVRELERRGTPRDPTYTPPGVDPDLMYTDEYVQSAVNPSITQSGSSTASSSHGSHFFRSCFTWMLAIGIVVFLVWFIFIKRWGGSEPIQGRKV